MIVAAVDFPVEIRNLRQTLGSIEKVTDLEALRAKIATLSEQAAAPDLWNDPEAAQKVTSQLSHSQSELDRIEKLGSRIDDLEVLVEPSRSRRTTPIQPLRPSRNWPLFTRPSVNWRFAPCFRVTTTSATR